MRNSGQEEGWGQMVDQGLNLISAPKFEYTGLVNLGNYGHRLTLQMQNSRKKIAGFIKKKM